MLIFDFTKIVEFYPYRQAFCNSSFQIDYLTKEDWEDVCDFLESQGYRPDNHITWKDQDGVCYTWSDHTLYIGTSIREGVW